MSLLNLNSRSFSPSLVIFDKDGTLIDFNFMWAKWATDLVERFVAATGIPPSESLYQTLGYDRTHDKVIAGSPLAANTMTDLRNLMEDLAREGGLSVQDADRAVEQAWFVPDPVELARPLADLPRLFSELRFRNILTAVATSDDRASTMATLRALKLASLVNAIVTADDGLPNKPEADMLLHLCRELNVTPAKAIMVGDSLADMGAARAAKLGLSVGVLSGVSSREHLEGHADVILENVGELLAVPRSTNSTAYG